MKTLSLSKSAKFTHSNRSFNLKNLQQRLTISEDAGKDGLLKIGDVWTESKNKYFITKIIAQSQISSIYSVNSQKGKFVLKVEGKLVDFTNPIEIEHKVYTLLGENSKSEGFLKLEEFFETDHLYAIVLPPMSANLKSFASSLPMKCINACQAIGCILNVLSAINKLHSIGYVHRNLTPENLLVEAPKRSNSIFKVKLIDFGLARSFKKDGKHEGIEQGRVPFVGTIMYASVLQLEEKESTLTCDIYSACLSILSVSCTRKLPWAQDFDLNTNTEKRLQFDCILYLKGQSFCELTEQAFDKLLKETLRGKYSGRSPHKAYYAQFKKILTDHLSKSKFNK